jgi:hypothetical protein
MYRSFLLIVLAFCLTLISCGSDQKSESIQIPLESLKQVSFIYPGHPLSPAGSCSGRSYAIDLTLKTLDIRDCSGPNRQQYMSTITMKDDELGQVKGHLGKLQFKKYSGKSKKKPVLADHIPSRLELISQNGNESSYNDDPEEYLKESDTTQGIVIRFSEVLEQILAIYGHKPQ